jgi:hypothetical protein
MIRRAAVISLTWLSAPKDYTPGPTLASPTIGVRQHARTHRS